MPSANGHAKRSEKGLQTQDNSVFPEYVVGAASRPKFVCLILAEYRA